MSCNSHTLAGIGLGCKDAIGSIKEVYLIKDEEVTDIQLDEAGSAVASITLADSATFKTYKFRKGTSSMTSTMTTDEAAGTMSIQTDLALQFTKMETAKRLEIMAMCMDSLKGIVLDSNGRYWLLGYDYPITASAATGNTGTAFADFNGYNITLTDNSREFPFEIPAAVMTTLAEKITAAPVGN